MQALDGLLELTGELPRGGIGHDRLVDLIEGVGERQHRRIGRRLARHKPLPVRQDAVEIGLGLAQMFAVGLILLRLELGR